MKENFTINGETLGASKLGLLAVELFLSDNYNFRRNVLHGNEVVPTLIGPQGCGKTTFLRRLLPQHLRELEAPYWFNNDEVARIHVGQAMKELGYEHVKPGNISCYKAVPLVAA